MRNPRHRYEVARAAINSGTSSEYSSLEQCLTGAACNDAAVAYAYDLFKTTEHRTILDAFLLAKVLPQLAATALQIPVEVIETYALLFMDVNVFRNALELRSYAIGYSDDTVRAAVFTGQEYLLWMFNVKSEHLEPRYIIRNTMIDAYMRGHAHRGNGVTSQVAKAAQTWMNIAIRNAELLEKLDPQTAKAAGEELRIALEPKDDTFSTETSPVPVENILH